MLHKNISKLHATSMYTNEYVHPIYIYKFLEEYKHVTGDLTLSIDAGFFYTLKSNDMKNRKKKNNKKCSTTFTI